MHCLYMSRMPQQVFNFSAMSQTKTKETNTATLLNIKNINVYLISQ